MYLVDWNEICEKTTWLLGSDFEKHFWGNRPLTLLLQGEASSHVMSLVFFSYPWFSNVFSGYRKRPVSRSGNWMLLSPFLMLTVLKNIPSIV